MNARVYTMWASMRSEDTSPWMIAAEDEFSWEANADRCDEVFADARSLAEQNGWDVREITLVLEGQKIFDTFAPVEVRSDVE